MIGFRVAEKFDDLAKQDTDETAANIFDSVQGQVAEQVQSEIAVVRLEMTVLAKQCLKDVETCEERFDFIDKRIQTVSKSSTLDAAYMEQQESNNQVSQAQIDNIRKSTFNHHKSTEAKFSELNDHLAIKFDDMDKVANGMRAKSKQIDSAMLPLVDSHQLEMEKREIYTYVANQMECITGSCKLEIENLQKKVSDLESELVHKDTKSWTPQRFESEGKDKIQLQRTMASL